MGQAAFTDTVLLLKSFLCSNGTQDIHLIKMQMAAMAMHQIKHLNCVSHLNVIRQYYMCLKVSTDHSYSIS